MTPIFAIVDTVGSRPMLSINIDLSEARTAAQFRERMQVEWERHGYAICAKQTGLGDPRLISLL